jgi:hypothetical protein
MHDSAKSKPRSVATNPLKNLAISPGLEAFAQVHDHRHVLPVRVSRFGVRVPRDRAVEVDTEQHRDPRHTERERVLRARPGGTRRRADS